VETVVLDYHTADLAATEKSVQDALDLGADRVILNLDLLSTLDADGVRGLIEILRSTRTAGSGEIALQSSKADVLRTLSVTALDRLFPVLKTEGEAA
jgi:anti-anti-sigma factor